MKTKIKGIIKYTAISLAIGALFYVAGINFTACAYVTAVLIVALGQRQIEPKDLPIVLVYLCLVLFISLIIFIIDKNIATSLILLSVGIVSAIVKGK